MYHMTLLVIKILHILPIQNFKKNLIKKSQESRLDKDIVVFKFIVV